MWHNTFHGLLPWYHNILFFYSVLDMISRPLSEKRFLDRVSQIGLIRGKWYTSESVAELAQENVLKASAIPAYDLSAMTAKRISSYWVREASPFLSVLPGDLQTVFIDPQVRELEALGVEIRYDSDVSGVVMHEGGVAAVALRDGTELSADVYALCTPFEVTRTWLHDRLYEADPELGNLHFLEAQPMAALHLRLRHELPDLPREHVFFHGSHYALSFIDVSRLWTGLDGNPQLSFISSNYGPLQEVSEEGAKDLLLEEIGEYLPITPADVESWELNPNTSVPLFINTIGAWPNRPRPKSRVKNLYLAGDFVKNAIDLACMEGAVSAALETAAQILGDHGEAESLPVDSGAAGVAAGVDGGRSHPADPGRGGGAADRLARRNTLPASPRRFGRPPPGDSEAAEGLTPAPRAIKAGRHPTPLTEIPVVVAGLEPGPAGASAQKPTVWENRISQATKNQWVRLSMISQGTAGKSLISVPLIPNTLVCQDAANPGGTSISCLAPGL